MSPDDVGQSAIRLPLARRALRQYEAALIRLQDLHASGSDQSDAADAVRDEMDGPWAALTAAERDVAGGLSADLYMLSGDEVREPGDGLDDAAILDRRRYELDRAQRWVEFLRLLRRGPTGVPPASIAYMRYKAYGALGLQAAAGRFIERASQLAPRDSLKVLAITHAQEVGDRATAVRRANAALSLPAAGPGLVIAAAGAVLASTRAVDPDLAEPQWRRVVAAVTRALSSPSIDDDERIFGLVYLGLAHEFLGDASGARDAFAAAAALDPFNPVVVDARAGQPPEGNRIRPTTATVAARLRMIEQLKVPGSGYAPV